MAIVCGFAFGSHSDLSAEVNTVINKTKPGILAPERVVLDATRTLQNESIPLATLTASNIQVEVEWDVNPKPPFTAEDGILRFDGEVGTHFATVIAKDKFTNLNSAYADLEATAVIRVDVAETLVSMVTGISVFHNNNRTNFRLNADQLTPSALSDNYYIYYRGRYFEPDGADAVGNNIDVYIQGFNIHYLSDNFKMVHKSIVTGDEAKKRGYVYDLYFSSSATSDPRFFIPQNTTDDSLVGKTLWFERFTGSQKAQVRFWYSGSGATGLSGQYDVWYRYIDGTGSINPEAGTGPNAHLEVLHPNSWSAFIISEAIGD